jgi:UDP-GlcNAc:undecaprenyl-phosphate GlcNAc-1-phosphate transferase
MLKIIFFFLFLNLLFLIFFDYFSNFFKLIDVPDNIRKIHKKPTPLIGGIILFINIILLLFLSIFNDEVFHKFFIFQTQKEGFLFIFCFVSIFLLGFFDDKFIINPYIKFFFFIIIISILLLDNNIKLDYIKLSFLNKIIYLKHFSFVFTILCFLLFINAFNFFDGINLQAGLYSLFLSTIIILINPHLFLFYFVIIFLIFFLYLNFNNKTFLGDNGSYLLSFIFGYYFIKLYKSKFILDADEIFILMLVPGLDILRLFFTRTLNGKSPFFPDKNHIHHLLLKKISYLKVNLILLILIIIPYLLYKLSHLKFLIIISTIIIYFLILFSFKKKNYETI